MFQTTQEHDSWIEPQGSDKPLVSDKQVVPITYTMEKRFFAVAKILKVCESFPFRQSKEACSILWAVRVFFGLPEKGRPNKYCL